MNEICAKSNHSTVFTLTIAVGVQDRPADAPSEGPWASDWKVVGNPTFAQAMSAVASLVLAYGGLPAYFSIASEMKDPRFYTRSVLICQGTATVVYIIIGVVVYIMCGSYVGSPALGSAGVLMKKICYGLVLPGLLVTEILYIHVSCTQLQNLNKYLTNKTS
jgi:amino acid transporter